MSKNEATEKTAEKDVKGKNTRSRVKRIGKNALGILAAVLTVAAAVLITFTYRSSRQKELIKLYSKVSANSNWRVNFK